MSVFVQRSNLGRLEGLSFLVGWSRFGPTPLGSQLTTTHPTIIWPPHCTGDQEDTGSNHSTHLFISSSFSFRVCRWRFNVGEEEEEEMLLLSAKTAPFHLEQNFLPEFFLQGSGLSIFALPWRRTHDMVATCVVSSSTTTVAMVTGEAQHRHRVMETCGVYTSWTQSTWWRRLLHLLLPEHWSFCAVAQLLGPIWNVVFSLLAGCD